MMPGTITERRAEAVTVEATTPTATSDLTGAALLGMLTYSPSLVLLGDDVDDPAVLRESAAIAFADSEHWEREAWAQMALDVLTGRTPSMLSDFVTRLHAAVTRTFGVTA